MTHKQAVARRIREYLETKNWSKYKLAKESALATSTVENLLSENGRSCTLLTLIDVCRALGAELSEFFDSDLLRLDRLDD